MSRLLQVYKKRPGFAVGEGVEFERLLSALLFLRAQCKTDTFELAQNVADTGSFDDNVLICSEQGRDTAYFVQQKHSQKEERPESVFIENLLNYYISYECIREKYENAVDELQVVYYTNAELSQDRLGEKCNDHILSTGGFTFQYTLQDKIIHDCFSELQKYTEFLHQLSKCSKRKIKARLNQKKIEFKWKELKSRLNKLESDPSSDQIRKFINEIDGLSDETKFTNFLDHLLIFHCQAGGKDKLMQFIACEFHRVCGITVAMDYDVDDLIKLFMDNIETWSKEKDESNALTKNSPLWGEVIKKLMEKLNSAKAKELESLQVRFNESEVTTWKERLQSSDTLKIIVNSSDTTLTALKMHQVLEVSEPKIQVFKDSKHHLVLSGDAVEKYWDLVLRICRTNWCWAVLVDGPIKPRRECALKMVTKKLVMIISRNSCSDTMDVYNDTCKLMQLDNTSCKSLMGKLFLFQGYKVCLEDFLSKDPEVIDIFSGDVLACLVSSENEIEVGTELQSVVDYYIPRTLVQKRNLTRAILDCEDTNTTLAITIDRKIFNKIISARFGKKLQNKPRIINLRNKAEEDSLKKQVFSEEQNIHLLRKDKNGFYWKWSKGNMDVVRNFIDPAHTKKYPPPLILDIPGDLKLIIAEPGMGKTTLLNYLAHQTKKADPTTCIIRINLIDHSNTEKLQLLSESEQVNALKDIVVSKNSNILEDELVKYIIGRSLNVVILIDGFDEISPFYAEQGIRLVKSLRQKNIGKLWITSRSVLNERLQNELSTLPISLEPFNINDQKDFLKKYWRNEKIKPSELDKFVTAVLDVMKRSLEYKDFELAAIPLQTMLIAEAFRGAYEEFEKTGDMQLPKQLDVIQLYELFMEKKYKIYLQTREAIPPTHPVYKKHFSRCEKDNNEKHGVLALKLLLTEEDVNSLNDLSITRLHATLVKNSEEIAGVGIVLEIRDGKAHFVHRTFAEYFLALWLINNFQYLRPFLLRKVSDPSFGFVLKWFDQMLAKEHPIHRAVLSNDKSEFQELLNESGDLEDEDDGGRCPVHVAAMYGRNSILRSLLWAGVSIEVTDKVLGWRPLQYADHFEIWESVELLLNNGASEEDLDHLTEIIKNYKKLNKLLSLVFDRGYSKLLNFILSKGVKIKEVTDSEGYTLLHKAAKHGQTVAVSYLMLYEPGVKKLGKFWSLLWPVVHRNFTSNSEFISSLKKTRLEVENNFGATPLHLAIIGNHKETVQWLLTAGADVNHRDCLGFTQLHWAVRAGCTSLARRVLSYDAYVNKLSGAFETPLHLAVKQLHGKSNESNLKIVQVLLAAGASTHFEDSSGLTPIHWAATNSDSNILEHMLENGADVNETDSQESSALHWAVWRGSKDNVKMLLDRGADVNVRNMQGNTPLHWAAERGNAVIVLQLLKSQANINSINCHGCTPLCSALKTLEFGVTTLLRELGGRSCLSCYDYNQDHV